MKETNPLQEFFEKNKDSKSFSEKETQEEIFEKEERKYSNSIIGSMKKLSNQEYLIQAREKVKAYIKEKYDIEKNLKPNPEQLINEFYKL